MEENKVVVVAFVDCSVVANSVVDVALVVVPFPVTTRLVEVLFTITRLVMVEVALLTRMGTEVVGERAPLKSSHDWPKDVPPVGHVVRQVSPVKQMEVAPKVVVVALVPRSVVAKSVVDVAFVAMSEEAKNAVEVPLVAFRFKVSSQPVVVALVVVRLPETSALPWTPKMRDGFVTALVVPTPTKPLLLTPPM